MAGGEQSFGGGRGNGRLGLGFEAENGAGRVWIRGGARGEGRGGTGLDDDWHVARKPRMDAGDDACGAGE